MQPIIGITAGEIVNKDEPWSPLTYGQSRTYVDAIIKAGGVPLILPIVSDLTALRTMYDISDGILLAGGNDPDPKLYGVVKSKLTVDVSVPRDTQELQLVQWIMGDNKPVLGICRGMQLLNIFLGGTLYQDIPTELPGSIDHNSSTHKKTLTDVSHVLSITPGTKLAAIVGEQAIGANAHHHQAVQVVAPELISNAQASDGVIEGLESPNRPYMLAVQAHPESLGTVEPRWQKLFSSFIEASNRSHED